MKKMNFTIRFEDLKSLLAERDAMVRRLELLEVMRVCLDQKDLTIEEVRIFRLALAIREGKSGSF